MACFCIFLGIKMKNLIFLAAILGTIFIGAFFVHGEEYIPNAGGNSADVGQYTPVTIDTYDSNRNKIQMTFTHKPQRVVVDELNTMETLLALGLGDSIVETSVSPKSMSYKRLLQEYPEEMAKIQKKTVHSLNTETVLSANPDLILGWKSTFTSILRRPTQWWNARGIKTYVVATSNHILNYGTIEDEKQFLADMGKIFHVEPKTNHLIREIQDELKTTQEAVQGKPQQRVMVIEVSGRGAFMNYDDGWLVGDMVRSLGGCMPVKEKRVGVEGLIEENPDVIFVVYFSDYQKDIIRSIFQQPEYSSLKAVQNNRICLLPFDCMYTSAIKTIKGIRLIKNGLYPELNASGKRS